MFNKYTKAHTKNQFRVLYVLYLISNYQICEWNEYV